MWELNASNYAVMGGLLMGGVLLKDSVDSGWRERIIKVPSYFGGKIKTLLLSRMVDEDSYVYRCVLEEPAAVHRFIRSHASELERRPTERRQDQDRSFRRAFAVHSSGRRKLSSSIALEKCCLNWTAGEGVGNRRTEGSCIADIIRSGSIRSQNDSEIRGTHVSALKGSLSG